MIEATTRDIRSGDLRLQPRERRRERWIAAVLMAAAVFTIAVTVAVIVVLARETFGFFLHPDVTVWEFLTSRQWTPLFAEKHFGIAPLVAGTFLVTVIALVVGVPMGLASAIYLSEYATPPVRRRVTGVLELLAGIPTVVLGYFALLFVTPILQQVIPGLNLFNPLSAGLVMGVMILPTVSSISIDAMQAVPHAMRVAGYGLGAA